MPSHLLPVLHSNFLCNCCITTSCCACQVLRLICIQSLANGGLKSKLLDLYEKEILQVGQHVTIYICLLDSNTNMIMLASPFFVYFLPGHTLPSSATPPSCQVYGYEYLPVLISLRKAGLLSLQEGKTHQSIRRQFRLLVEPTGRVREKHKQIFTVFAYFTLNILSPVASLTPTLTFYYNSIPLLPPPPLTTSSSPSAPTLTPHHLILTLCSHPHPSPPHPHPLLPPSPLTTSSSPSAPTLTPH